MKLSDIVLWVFFIIFMAGTFCLGIFFLILGAYVDPI